MQIIFKYLLHYLKGRGRKGYGIHSPTIFHLVTAIIHDFTPFYCFKDIEVQRENLLNNQTTIEINDLGTGSRKHKTNHRTIASIAKCSLKPKKQAQLLFRLVNYFKPINILEIGTSLGITSSYLASVNSKANIITLEGCPEQLKIANSVFYSLNIKNIESICGNFASTLPMALYKTKSLDFVFFDGNHSQKATQEYFELCLPYAHSKTIFIFDDIHLNSEMEAFWIKLIKRKEISVTLDLFHFGIVFFKKELAKEDYKVRF